MNTTFSSRWFASLTLAPLAVLTLQGLALNAYAFTDSNAELKEAAADRSARVVVVGKATPAPAPVRTAWVPQTAKSLDGFKPVFPREPVVVARQRPMLQLAKAEVPASSGQR
jgi:hypothetical protein